MEEIRDIKIEDLLNVVGQLTEKQLRSPENSIRASNIAKLPEIRDIMTRLQRDFINLYAKRGVVLDGRDIGTIVVPDACCKLFITADLEERAKRRFSDLDDKNITFEEVLDNMKRRDAQDISRKIAPLTCDETYVVIDTTGQSMQESFKICKEEVRKAFVGSEYRSFI